MIQRHKGGESVVSLCKEYGVSRNILYRWLNRYEETGQESIEALASRRPRGEEHYRYVPEAPGLILNLVTAHPKYGNIEISRVLEETAGRHILGPTAVHNFLHSMQLSTYEQRVAYARTQAVPIPKAA